MTPEEHLTEAQNYVALAESMSESYDQHGNQDGRAPFVSAKMANAATLATLHFRAAEVGWLAPQMVTSDWPAIAPPLTAEALESELNASARLADSEFIPVRYLTAKDPCPGLEQPGHMPCKRPLGHAGPHWGRPEGPVSPYTMPDDVAAQYAADNEGRTPTYADGVKEGYREGAAAALTRVAEGQRKAGHSNTAAWALKCAMRGMDALWPEAPTDPGTPPPAPREPGPAAKRALLDELRGD